MNAQRDQQALSEIYGDIPVLRPSDIELSIMFSELFPESEDIPNLPHGYGQLVSYSSQI